MSTHKLSYNTYNKQMERIICVEQPLHKFVDFRASSALSVIEEQERYGEHRAELYKPVYLIYRKEIDNGIDRDPEHAPRYLLFGSPCSCLSTLY